MALASDHVNWGRVFSQGVVAGIVGGIVLVAFIFFAFFLPQHGTIAQLFAADAANIHQSSPLIGAVARVCVGIVWGVAYAYIANSRPSIMNNPWISGPVYGFIVWLAMQLVLMAGGVWRPFPLNFVFVILIGHMLFFGVPVALTVRALSKTA
jgi:hypothetical protein